MDAQLHSSLTRPGDTKERKGKKGRGRKEELHSILKSFFVKRTATHKRKKRKEK